jgi:hypothetical protein
MTIPNVGDIVTIAIRETHTAYGTQDDIINIFKFFLFPGDGHRKNRVYQIVILTKDLLDQKSLFF